MNTIDDLIQFASRLDIDRSRVYGIISAINKCLLPVLTDSEMLDVTVLSINEVTRRQVPSISSKNTLDSYRQRVRGVMRQYKRHLEFKDVPLTHIPLRDRDSVLTPASGLENDGNVNVTLSIHELKLLRRILSRLPE